MWVGSSSPALLSCIYCISKAGSQRGAVTGTEQLSSSFTAVSAHPPGLSRTAFFLGGRCPVQLLHENSHFCLKKRNSKHDIYPAQKPKAPCQVKVPVFHLLFDHLTVHVPSFSCPSYRYSHSKPACCLPTSISAATCLVSPLPYSFKLCFNQTLLFRLFFRIS